MSECLKKHSKILFVLYHLMKFILLCWGQSTFCGLMEPELLYFLRMKKQAGDLFDCSQRKALDEMTGKVAP